VLISVVLLALLMTGVLIWTRRRLRRPNRAGVSAEPAMVQTAR